MACSASTIFSWCLLDPLLVAESLFPLSPAPSPSWEEIQTCSLPYSAIAWSVYFSKVFFLQPLWSHLFTWALVEVEMQHQQVWIVVWGFFRPSGRHKIDAWLPCCEWHSSPAMQLNLELLKTLASDMSPTAAASTVFRMVSFSKAWVWHPGQFLKQNGYTWSQPFLALSLFPSSSFLLLLPPPSLLLLLPSPSSFLVFSPSTQTLVLTLQQYHHLALKDPPGWGRPALKSQDDTTP